jgi:thymidylate synthase ThyX
LTAQGDTFPEHATPVQDHGFVRLDDAMADDLSVANAARVSFARRKTELDESDEGLIRFLMRDRHGTPFEHNAFRYHIRCPIFVAREWFRHRIGCLTGDTVVTFVDVNGHTSPKLEKTIDELWRMWSRGERDGHAMTDQQRDARWRARRMRLRVLNEETGEFTVGRLADVINKGVQPVYLLTLEDGKELTVTENHRLLTSAGWKRMRDAVGLEGEGEHATMTAHCELMVNGKLAYRERDWLAARRCEGKSVDEIAAEAGCSYHTVRKWLAIHDLRFTRVEHRCHRAIHRTQLTELAFARRHTTEVGFAIDVDAPVRRGFALTAHPVRVLGVRYVGCRPTYDLSVAGPWHNFVANGIVVHNSFNEFSLRYARATDDFYVPEAEDVRTQVGKPGAYTFEQVTPELAERTREEFQAVYDQAYATYERLVEAGVAREVARAVLPVGAYTQFYWTVNARALMNFVSLRNSEFAQLEIRRYAEVVEALFAERMPVTHAAFVAAGRVAP